MVLDNLFKINHETLHVEIEPNSFCNAKCIHCPRDLMPQLQMMSMGTFETILEKYFMYREKMTINTIGSGKDWPKFVFSGGGEPILNPLTPDFIRLSRDQGFTCKVYSNGIKLNENNIESLVASGVNEISVSFLGTTPKEHRDASGSSQFEKCVQNMIFLRDAVKGTDTKFKVTYNALDTLTSSDKDIHKFWADLGIHSEGPYVVWNRGGLLKNFNQARDSLDKNTSINFAQDIWCMRLQHYDTIRADGEYVHCCCSFFDKDAPLLGNVNSSTLDEVHRGYDELLRLKSGNKQCASCIKPTETYLISEVLEFLEKEGFRY